MRLWVAVREGDSVATSHSSFGAHIGGNMTTSAAFIAPNADTDRTGRWADLDQKVLASAIEVDIEPNETVRQLTSTALQLARSRGIAYADDRQQERLPELLRGGRLHSVWLECSVTREQFDPDSTVLDAGLAEGDLVVLCIKWMLHILYRLLPAPRPEAMFDSLQLAATTLRQHPEPRLWGMLLYTDEDAELATYVRTHFDELNALSGPVLQILVVERPVSWSRAKRYWRQHMDPSLLRMFGAMRWLFWQPYDRERCYDIARALGISPARFPCLVLFRGTEADTKLVFPIQSVSPAYFRHLFGEIDRVIGEGSRPYSIKQEFENSRGYSGVAGRTKHTPADPDVAFDATVTALSQLGAAESADSEAFGRVLASEQRILSELNLIHDAEPAGVTKYEFHGHTLFAHQGEPAMTENFNFHGQTTFVNHPVNTVLRDFQNTYLPSPEREQLSELLRLVLSSSQLPNADKESAALTVHKVSDAITNAEPDRNEARGLLVRLQNTLSQAADIANPALTIIAKIMEMIGHG